VSQAFLRVCSRTLNEQAGFYTSMYRLIIEYSFMFTNDSFNNRVVYKLNLNKLTRNFASFTSLVTALGVSKWE
jgi:hypothetical protein